MSRYLLLMRGDQAEFLMLKPEDKKKVIAEHIQFSKELEAKNIILDGDGCSESSVLLEKDGRSFKVNADPFAGTQNQLSGFYVIKAKNNEDAIKIAKGCPALKHGESIEVILLGH